jgi:MinD superfamily P-loop ATPase
MLEIDEDRCHVCGKCLAKTVCRGNAIRVIDRGETPFIDMSRCWACMVCMSACPFDAVVRRDAGV